MNQAFPTNPPDFEQRWRRALEYFQQRKSVIFLSQARFWEPHAFPQQSLAKYLSQAGIRVTWLDGYGWRPYRPVVRFPSPLLDVYQLPQIPATRFGRVRQASETMQQGILTGLIQKAGGNPVVWVQDAYPESLVARLPYIDVYSVFDNPYLQESGGGLCQRASLILCQNSYAARLFARSHPTKTQVALPPLDMEAGVFEESNTLTLPRRLPTPILGNIGSIMSNDFDFDLLEIFIRSLPNHGFLFMGRSDATGHAQLKRLEPHKNFLYLPWVPRSQVASAWKLLQGTLLLYRSFRPQDGAFPTRALESLHFGVPCIATKTPKTGDLEGFVPRAEFADELIDLALQFEKQSQRDIRESYLKLRERMDPKLHLIHVAESLSRR